MVSDPFLHHRLDLVLVHLADRAGVRVDGADEGDHGVLRGVHRGLAALPELLADGQVAAASCPVTSRFASSAGRLLAEHLLREGVVGSERLAQLGERPGELEDLELVVDGGGAEERLGDGRELRLLELLEPVRVRLRALVGAADQRAGEAEVVGS